MQLPAPKSSMIHAFLLMKGWTPAQRNEKYFVLAPPSDMHFQNGFLFNIPVHEDAIDYPEYSRQLVFSIAEMYDLNKWQLLEDLSKTSLEMQKEIERQQKDIEFKQRLLALAS